jgi:hypothetical protein
MPVRTRSHRLYAPCCTSPADHMQMRVVQSETREHARDRAARTHAVRTFQDAAGPLRYAGLTHDEGHRIKHHRAPDCATFTHSRTHRVYAERGTSTQKFRTRFVPDSAGPEHAV